MQDEAAPPAASVETLPERGVPRPVVVLPPGADLPPVCVVCGRSVSGPRDVVPWRLSRDDRGLRLVVRALLQHVLGIRPGRFQETLLPHCRRHRRNRILLVLTGTVPGLALWIVAGARPLSLDVQTALLLFGLGTMVAWALFVYAISAPVHVLRLDARGAWIADLPREVVDAVRDGT